MISVIIPTLNSAHVLGPTLAALVPAVVDGVVRQVIVADGGSSDATLDIADAAGAEIVQAGQGRGVQLATGAQKAGSPWLLFLHSDTVLEPGWHHEASDFMERVDIGRHPTSAAAFRFTLDDTGIAPRLLEVGVSLRCGLLRLPYGDQGLLIPARLYNEIGGFRPLLLMEDVDLVRRLGRRRLVMLRSRAITSAARFKESGYSLRVLRNLSCLTLYYLRVSPTTIARLYG